MNILVLAAGTSTEREVSISSGSNVCRALRSLGHNAVIVDVFFGTEDADLFMHAPNGYDLDEEVKKIESKNAFVKEAVEAGNGLIGPNVIELGKKADIVFMALHGSNGEDGRLQATFDLMGIKYTGAGYLGSAMAMDKSIARSVMKANGIPVAAGTTVTKENEKESLESLGITLPCVVKPACGGSSVGVAKCTTEEEYRAALADAFTYEDVIVVEEFIKGREFSIGIFNEEALPIIEIVTPEGGFYDYENKYNGKTKEVCPALLDEETTKRMQAYAVQAGKALLLSAYARIDFLLKEDGSIYCLEANTLPGMTPTSLLPQEAAVLGMDYPTLCEKLIALSMEKYK